MRFITDVNLIQSQDNLFKRLVLAREDFALFVLGKESPSEMDSLCIGYEKMVKNVCYKPMFLELQ